MSYAPDLVLHGFFVGNDFTLYGEDNYQYRGIRIENEPGISRYWPRNFFLTDLIRNQLIRWRDLRQIELEQKTGVAAEAGYLSEEVFSHNAVAENDLPKEAVRKRDEAGLSHIGFHPECRGEGRRALCNGHPSRSHAGRPIPQKRTH